MLSIIVFQVVSFLSFVALIDSTFLKIPLEWTSARYMMHESLLRSFPIASDILLRTTWSFVQFGKRDLG